MPQPAQPGSTDMQGLTYYLLMNSNKWIDSNDYTWFPWIDIMQWLQLKLVIIIYQTVNLLLFLTIVELLHQASSPQYLSMQ